MKYTLYITRISTYEIEAKPGEDPFDVYADTNPDPIDEETINMACEPDVPEPED